MRAVQFTTYGDPDVLSVAQAPEPHAGPGRIRIQVKAASVNPLDWKIRSGRTSDGSGPDHPVILGFDAAGYVDEIGDGVDDVAVDDEVFGLADQAHAEYAVLRAWAPKPPEIDWAVAAAAGVAGETAIRALRLLGVGEDDTVFIDGGAGGVGSAAVQLAVARGARVIASGGAHNDDYLREIGAVPVRSGDGVAERVREAAGPGGVTAVLDVVGKTPVEELISIAPSPVQVVTIANFGASGSGARTTRSGDGDAQSALAEVTDRLRANQLVIKVQTYPFERAAEAHRQSQDGHVRGKLVLLP